MGVILYDLAALSKGFLRSVSGDYALNVNKL